MIVLIILILNTALSIFLSLLASMPHILSFQLNEYMFLRYKGYVKDVGLFRAFFPIKKFRFPAKSIRNILILGVVFATLLTFYILLFYFVKNGILIFFISFLAYPIAIVGVVLGVILTSPLSSLMRKRLIYIAKRQLSKSDVKIIAVTGSYGKSSVKEFLHRILSTKYLTGKTRGNHNTDVGIAIELGLQVTKNMKYFIAEMGAYTNGDIRKLCEMYKPEIGVIAGIGNQHAALFGSQQNIIQTKFEMVEGVKGKCYVNVDWESSEEVVREYRKKINDGSGETDKRIITYGALESADVTFTNLGFEDGFSKFGLHIKHVDKGLSLRTKLIGEHNLINLIPAILIAEELEVEEDKIKIAVESLEQILGKLSLHKSSFGFNILNDSYNSNLNGFLAALETLKTVNTNTKAKLYASSLGIFELGNEKTSSYIQIVNRLKQLNITLLTTDPLFKELENDIDESKNRGNEDNLSNKDAFRNVALFKSEAEILNYIKGSLKRKDTLLLEGRHSPTFTTQLGIIKAY